MRVKRGTVRARKRRRLLKQTKGYRWGRKKLVRAAHTAILKAGANAYRGRKQKKRVNRRQWNIRINAAVRPYGISYSRFMHGLKAAKIALDRKVLAHLGEHEPAIFAAIVDAAKKAR